MSKRHKRTRGKTRAGRLSRLDAWVLDVYRERLDREGLLAVDIGIGEAPDTSVELWEVLRGVREDARLVAVDHDSARVELARGLAGGRIEVREGSFRLPLGEGERPVLVRCMNVLRNHPEEAVGPAHEAMLEGLAEGGVLIEGSTDKLGGVLGAHVVEKRAEGVKRGLLLSTDFSCGFAPILFRDHLPRDMRRRVRPGEPVFDRLFAPWQEAWEWVRGEAEGPAEAFVLSAQGLAERGVEVDVTRERLERGELLVWNPLGS